MITLLAIGLFQTVDCNLSTLASPALVEDLIKSGDVEAYRRELLIADGVISTFLRLSNVQKKDVIRSWWLTVRTNHKEFSATAPIERRKARQYLITTKMSEADLTKLDILRLAENKEPFFHTQEWLYELLSSDINRPFSLSHNFKSLPTMFAGLKGNQWERGAPSFDWFFKDEASSVSRWIEEGYKGVEPEPMTPRKMYSKPIGPKDGA